MTQEPASLRRMMDKLGFQLAAILAAVLLPLAFISLFKSLALVTEIEARAEAALLGETMQASAKELRLIQEARGAAELLAATIAPFINDTATCSRVVSQLADSHPQYSLIAFVSVSGMMQCSSSGGSFDFSNHPLFPVVIDEDHSGFVVNRQGPISGVSVLGISQKVYSADGDYLGIVSLSLPHSELEESDAEGGRADDLDLFTFDSKGEVLTASPGLSDTSALPRDRSLSALKGVEPLSFSASSMGGDMRIYSIVPLVPGELFALGSRRAAGYSSFGQTLFSTPILLPALMWLASLIVAWLAVERLVTRNVRKLSKSIKFFARGNRLVGDVDVGNAPLEIREMAEAYASMTASIMRDEAELENTIHQKEVLLREVHHRVKNNLQLIASIMNMQVRRVKSSEARRMLTELRDRVMSLATIHRELFETAGSADVHADELLTGIVRQVADAGFGPDKRFDATTDLDDIRMVPDQAAPLGLLVGEALTNAMKYGSDVDGRGIRINVSLRRSEGENAVLEISNSTARAENTEALQPGLGTQLIAAFAMQLGGKVERELSEGVHLLRVAFQVKPLAEAEACNGRQQANDGNNRYSGFT